MIKSEIKLTDKQMLCAESIDTSLAIIAGAGSGKTAVLVERIRHILQNSAASLSEIVAITFTEKAAGELLYKIAKTLPNKFKSQIDQAVITTIDGFCSAILREDAASIGLNPDFSVLEEHAAQILIHRNIVSKLKNLLSDSDECASLLVEELDFRHTVGLIEDMVANRWYFGQTDQSSGSREQILFNAALSIFKKVLIDIETEKRELGAIDFVDLEIKTLELLKNDANARNRLQNKIKHLLIDEYQDTSDIQSEIVRQLFNPDKNILCIVGDPGQSIYRFRGANPNCLIKMREHIAANKGLCIELNENFRSARPVIDSVNNIFDECESGNFLKLNYASGTESGSFEKINITGDKLSSEELRTIESIKVASLIKEQRANGTSYGDIAVLFRSFSDISIYERALKGANIPYYRSGGRTFLAQPEISDIILCLGSLIDQNNDTLAYGLARSSIFGLSDDECYELFSKRDKSIFSILAEIDRSGLLTKLSNSKSYLSLAELIREISRGFHLDKIFEAINPSGQSITNIEKLIVLAETISTEHSYSIEEFIEYINDIKSKGSGISEPPIFSPHDDAVKLLTVHAAKGLEFKIVILADIYRQDRSHALPYIFGKSAGTNSLRTGFKLSKEGNPLAEREKMPEFEAIQEEETTLEDNERMRLLYVALTRAKESLIIMHSSSVNSTNVWVKTLQGILPKINEHIVPAFSPETQKCVPEIIERTERTASHLPEIPVLTVSHLESYHRCPREYFIKYNLRIPSDNLSFMDTTLSANLTGSIVHKVIYLLSKDSDADIDELIKISAMELGPRTLSGSDLKRINSLLRNYSESGFCNKHLSSPLHEIPFVFSIGRAVIRGTIDCIYRTGEDFAILDFKTDKTGSESTANKVDNYRLQTLTYAIAADRALKRLVSKMTLLFLDNGEKTDIAISKKDLDDGTITINNIIENIIKSDFSFNKDNNRCIKCQYRELNICNR